MRTVVINLTRFGDLLQTQPALSGLRARGSRVDLVCLDAFQGAASLLSDVDRIFPLPGARFLAGLDAHWPSAVADFASWTVQAQDPMPARVLNLTPTLPARLLGRVLGQNGDGGFGLDAFGFGQHSSPWAVFLQAASAYRGCSPFNLVDVFQRVAGLDPGPFALKAPDREAQICAGSLLEGLHGPGLVALQLGASQGARRWPVAAFARAGGVVWEKTGCTPVLVGSAGEAHLGLEFARLAQYPFRDLIGRTDVPTLAAVLLRARLLLTNDTGTMHLAAGLGVPVAAVFLATAQPFDTGPYLEGSISLEPDMACHPCSFGQVCPNGMACQRRMDPEAVGLFVEGFLRSGDWTVPPGLGARVWQGRRDGYGFMGLVSLSGHETEDRSRWVSVQRDVYRQFLDQKPVGEMVGQSWPCGQFKRRLKQDLQRGLLLLALVQEQGRLLTMNPGAPVRKKFLANCQNVQDFFAGSPALGALGPMWNHQAQDHGGDMAMFLGLCGRYSELLRVFQQCLGLA